MRSEFLMTVRMMTIFVRKVIPCYAASCTRRLILNHVCSNLPSTLRSPKWSPPINIPNPLPGIYNTHLSQLI